MNDKSFDIKKSRPPRWYVIFGADIAAVLLLLLIFYFVLYPTGGSKKKGSPIKSTLHTPRPVITGSPSSSDSTASSDTDAAVTYESGDFSARFPNYDTGAKAAYSYQTDNLRIAITRGYSNNSTYLWADVWIRSINEFRTAFANNDDFSRYDKPLNIATAVEAVFAVSGDYCGVRNEGIVIRNGLLYRDSLNSDICVLFTDGTMETYKKGTFTSDALISRGVWQAWSFGPALLDNGKAIDYFSDSIRVANPRCAIGYIEPGHYCFAVVDGRQEKSEGMTLTELSALFASFGCKCAYNLDGGATATMIFKGEVINTPCDGGRPCSDIICFGGRQ